MADNIIKSSLKKPRDRFLAQVTGLLAVVQASLDNLAARLTTIEKAQNKITADQEAIYRDTVDKLHNSGTLVLSEREMITKIFSGTKIFLDPRDLVVAPHIALDHIWEYPISMAWLSVVQPNDVVIDIGANFGYFGLIASQKMDRSSSKVIFFEANPHLIPYIRKTLTMDWLHGQCIIENLGIADKEGKATLTVLRDSIGSSSLHSKAHQDKYLHTKMDMETEETITVKATTLDAYCQTKKIDRIDLIKMDIEGYEEKAYAGMRQIVAASPNVTLFVEFTKESYDDPKAFYEQMLKDFGHVYLIRPDGKLTKPKNTSYERVIGSPTDWVMPVFSKNAKLASS
jgi:FkbM family methyltransferase